MIKCYQANLYTVLALLISFCVDYSWFTPFMAYMNKPIDTLDKSSVDKSLDKPTLKTKSASISI